MTITKTINQPDEVINEFANNLGYQTFVANPAYVSTTDEVTFEVTDNGEPQTIPNPESPTEFVSSKFDDVLTEWLTQFAERTALADATAQAKAGVQLQKDAVKATVTTNIS